jgi:TRAP-type C4-dicarboxylate transport system permease small subunit
MTVDVLQDRRPVPPIRMPGAPLARLAAALDRGTCAVCVALFAAILVVMILQVSFRYLLNSPLTWTEELARILYIWACYLGAPVALRRGTHVAIVFMAERLPRAFARLVGVWIHGVSLIFFVTLAVLGTMLALRSHSVEAITLPIPWSLIYAAAPLSAVLMILQSLDGGRRLLWEKGGEARA